MAGTTTNLGLTYPTSTDYVYQGATAMQTIADGIDGKIASGTYPNQLAFVSGGQSRPVPYATATKSVSLAGTSVAAGNFVNATVTWNTASRFTQAPAVSICLTSGPSGSANIVPRVLSTTLTGFTYYYYNVGTAAATWAAMSADVIAVQMTSAATYN
jgi:hypothetical protein